MTDKPTPTDAELQSIGAGGETTGATDMTTQQPEALRLANILRGIDARSLFANEKLSAASAALENQHARITELESQLAQRFDAADVATAAQPAAPARDLAAVIKGAADKLDAAVRCHPNAVDTLIHEALEILDGDREPDATPASRGQAPADAAPSAGAVAGPDDIDAIALTRYKVVHSHDSMFHRFAVVAGDGKQQLYLGRETECQNMTRKFAGAFLDGAFYQSQIAAAPTPAAQAADSVQEDAARYRWLREGNDAKHGAAWYVAVNLYGCEWDAAIDAAMNKGGAA